MVDSYTRCPEPEVLAAYVDRGLSLAERARVDHHLASCPQCLALVAGVVRTVADVPEFMPHAGPAVETASRVVTRRTLVGVLAAAAAVIAVLFMPSLVRPWLDGDAGLVNLVGVSEQRSVLGRLTGGFPHAPLGVPPAGGQGGRAAETDRILLTAAKIRESFGERQTPSRLHELGLSQLLAGRYNDAADALLAASREQPANARYLNDVAAVQLERARLGLRPDDLPRALAAADRARRLDPSLAEAWFNRALAITALSMREQAKAAWTDYLARDGTSAWALEARARLDALANPTALVAWLAIERRLQETITPALAEEAVRTQMSEARSLVEGQLLPAWARAVTSTGIGREELDRLRLMGDAFARVAGDATYQDCVTAIEQAEARGPQSVQALAEAHLQYAEGTKAFADDRFPRAQSAFEAAQPGLQQANSPFAVRAGIELGAIAFITGRSAEAATRLNSGLVTARERGYAYAAGRSTWFLGLAAFGRGQLDEVESYYDETLATFERMGDVEQAAGAHNLLASLHGYLGDETTAWRHRQATLAVLPETRSQRLEYIALMAAAGAVRRQDPEASLFFQDAVVASARRSGRLAAIVESLSARASILSELGRHAEASRDLDEARASLEHQPNQALRERIEESILAAEGDAFRTTDPARAIASAQLAIERVQRRGDRLRIAQLSLKVAKANIAWGHLANADRAIDSGIRAFEQERASLSDEGRVSTLDESWQLFDAAMQLAIHHKDYTRAFAMAEKARARTLAETNSSFAGRSLAAVQQQLAPDEAVLTLNQFDDELAVWVITRNATTVTLRPLSRVDAQRLIARQANEIRHEAAMPDASADLYNEILKPVGRELTGVVRLTVVPDAWFANASFAALWDGSRKRFLVEQMVVTTAPSVASVAANRPARDPAEAINPLIMAVPAAGLAGAEAVAAAYRQPMMVVGAAATRSRFMADAPTRSIVHLSVATRANSAYPLLSGMRMSDEPGRRYTSELLGRDIAAGPMRQTRLVSIDTIRTDISSDREGSQDLARAFMAAGVPAVLGTLPGADEAATRPLMVGFHRLMSTGITADEALNTLQRNVLRSNGRRLGAWSALVLYGSDR